MNFLLKKKTILHYDTALLQSLESIRYWYKHVVPTSSFCECTNHQSNEMQSCTCGWHCGTHFIATACSKAITLFIIFTGKRSVVKLITTKVLSMVHSCTHREDQNHVVQFFWLHRMAAEILSDLDHYLIKLQLKSRTILYGLALKRVDVDDGRKTQCL